MSDIETLIYKACQLAGIPFEEINAVMAAANALMKKEEK